MNSCRKNPPNPSSSLPRFRPFFFSSLIGQRMPGAHQGCSNCSYLRPTFSAQFGFRRYCRSLSPECTTDTHVVNSLAHSRIHCRQTVQGVTPRLPQRHGFNGAHALDCLNHLCKLFHGIAVGASRRSTVSQYVCGAPAHCLVGLLVFGILLCNTIAVRLWRN